MMVGCDKASYLVSKKQEATLSITEAFQLKMHLIACKMCRHFEDQSEFINKKMSEKMTIGAQEEQQTCISKDRKAAMKKLMEQ